MLLGRGLCDELITRPEESYRLWCVVVCDLRSSKMRMPWSALGRSATRKEENNKGKDKVHAVKAYGRGGGVTKFNFKAGTGWKRVVGLTLLSVYPETPVHVVQEAGWPSDFVWIFWEVGDRTAISRCSNTQ